MRSRHVEVRRNLAVNGEVTYCINVGRTSVAEVGQVLTVVPAFQREAGSIPSLAVVLCRNADDDIVVGIASVPVAEVKVALSDVSVSLILTAPLHRGQDALCIAVCSLNIVCEGNIAISDTP